jgi:hypothetical protein
MSAARRDLDCSAASARLLFDGNDAILHNTVRKPSRREHRSLPAASARFLCGRTLTPAIITDITLSRKTLGKFYLQLRHFRDVTLTPAGITDIMLSRMTLGKCRLLLPDVTLTPARITDITLWRKCLAPAAIMCPGFCTRSLRRR